MYWPKLNGLQIRSRIFGALAKNLDYRSEKILGIPATYLDPDIFYPDAPFLKDAPFLSALIANPNHIGCHTLSEENEPIFRGTQEIERDLLKICAEGIFNADEGSYDGYVASGGTEANIEAAWIYRNYFISARNAAPDEIALVFSSDTHYSFHKAADLLQLRKGVVRVNENDRSMDAAHLSETIVSLRAEGIKYFIINVNLSTTMFGSVDDIDTVANCLTSLAAEFKLHVDAAFGGFVYPFTNPNSRHHFGNAHVSSITIDGHKMLQTPYGTGIFLVRKHLMPYVCTAEASYVRGKDYTLCGSRSGANAISVWMILSTHGSTGWTVKMHQLLDRTDSLCSALDDLGVKHFRNEFLNIIAIRAKHITRDLALRYMLVPDNHDDPKWYKIVVMHHVRQGVLDEFLSELKAQMGAKRKMK